MYLVYEPRYLMDQDADVVLATEDLEEAKRAANSLEVYAVVVEDDKIVYTHEPGYFSDIALEEIKEINSISDEQVRYETLVDYIKKTVEFHLEIQRDMDNQDSGDDWEDYDKLMEE
jgi:hypothetical protein